MQRAAYFSPFSGPAAARPEEGPSDLIARGGALMERVLAVSVHPKKKPKKKTVLTIYPGSTPEWEVDGWKRANRSFAAWVEMARKGTAPWPYRMDVVVDVAIPGKAGMLVFDGLDKLLKTIPEITLEDALMTFLTFEVAIAEPSDNATFRSS